MIERVRLYLVWTPEALDGDPWRPLERALESGAVEAVQLRKKSGADASDAQRMRALCDEHGALFVVNDDAHAAAAWHADGVHVGQDDMTVSDARQIVGPDRVVGLSTHDAAEIRAAGEASVDYVGLGPCFPTGSKALTLAPGGPELVARCRPPAGSLPVFPIGGITPDNAGALVAAGADRLAVGGGVLAADDPAAAARRIRALLPD